jgi:hypothetical protein
LTCTAATATGVPPVAVVEAKQSKSKEPRTLKPENLEPTPEPKPQPTPMAIDKAKGLDGSKRICKDCGEPLLRGVNHLMVCKGVSLPPTQMVEADGKKRESIVVERKTSPATPLVSPRAADPPRVVEPTAPPTVCLRCGAADGKHVNDPGMVCPVLKAKMMREGMATSPDSTPCRFCGKAPRRNPTSDYCMGCWNERQRTGLRPKFMDEIAKGISQ